MFQALSEVRILEEKYIAPLSGSDCNSEFSSFYKESDGLNMFIQGDCYSTSVAWRQPWRKQIKMGMAGSQ